MKLRNSLYLVLALSLSTSVSAWSADELSDSGAVDSASASVGSASTDATRDNSDATSAIQNDDGIQRGGGGGNRGGGGAPSMGGGGGNRGGGSPGIGGGQRPEPQPVRPEPQPVRPEPVQGPGRPGPGQGPVQGHGPVQGPGRPDPGPQPFRPGPQQPGRPDPGRSDGGRGRTFNPVALRGGIFQGNHWNHPEFVRPVFSWEWANVSVVTCTAEDSEGNLYPVTESEFSGFEYEQRLSSIEDSSLDMCYDQSGGDTGCFLTGCTPQY